MRQQLETVVVVALALFLSLAVTWVLTHIGPVESQAAGVVTKGGITVRFAVAGIIATFVVVAAIILLALHWFGH